MSFFKLDKQLCARIICSFVQGYRLPCSRTTDTCVPGPQTVVCQEHRQVSARTTDSCAPGPQTAVLQDHRQLCARTTDSCVPGPQTAVRQDHRQLCARTTDSCGVPGPHITTDSLLEDKLFLRALEKIERRTRCC